MYIYSKYDNSTLYFKFVFYLFLIYVLTGSGIIHKCLTMEHSEMVTNRPTI